MLQPGTPRTTKVFATQYNCGSDDVIMENRTHVYWSDYYITTGRLRTNLATIPMLSDFGLTLILAPTPTNVWESAATMFRVLTPMTWVTCIITMFCFAFTLWFVDHGGTHRTMQESLSLVHPELFESSVARHARGYLVRHNFFTEIPRYLITTYQQVIQDPSVYVPKTISGASLYTVFGLFSLIFISSYTSALTAELSRPRYAHITDGIHDIVAAQKRGTMKGVCVPLGAAYVTWLEVAFSGMQFVHVPGGIDAMTSALQDHECDGIITVRSAAELAVHDPRFCLTGIYLRGETLKEGLQDFAIGVRSDLSDVEAALSFWVQELRSCHPNAPGSACYNGLNMQRLYNKWYRPEGCHYSSSGLDSTTALETSFFLLPLMMVWGSLALGCCSELFRDQLRDRLSVAMHGSQLRKLVRKVHYKCVVANVISMEALQKDFIQV